MPQITAREPGATAYKRLLSGLRLTHLREHRWFSDLVRGKDQHAISNIIIKGLLNAHCVQSPVLALGEFQRKSEL